MSPELPAVLAENGVVSAIAPLVPVDGSLGAAAIAAMFVGDLLFSSIESSGKVGSCLSTGGNIDL